MPLRQRGADDGELLQLATQLADLPHRTWGLVRRYGIHVQAPLALHALPLPLRVAIAFRQVLAVQPQDLEVALPALERFVIYAIGIELAFDPAHHAGVRHAIHVARTRPIGQAIQCVQSGVVRRHRRRGGRHLRGERRRDQDDRDQQGNSHSSILTVVPMRS